MKVIYNDIGGAHSTALAAAIHLNILPKDRIPTKKEIMNINYFDTMKKEDLGKIIYRGKDKQGNEIYTLGRKSNKELVLNSVKSAYELGGGNIKDLIFIDTMPTVNILMKIGGFSSRALNLVSFGRPIVLSGSQKAYSNIINLVEDTKSKISNQ